LEDAVFLPFLLVLFLDCDKGISFFSLKQSIPVSGNLKVRRGETERRKLVLTPFNSFVLETVTASNAFAVASTAAITVIYSQKKSPKSPEL
jgi:hypothetical protein